MIGVVVVSHGKLAQEMVAVTEHVVGKQEQLKFVGIEPDDDGENARRLIISAIETVNTGDGVVVLTDMFGGTPSNLAISVMKEKKIEVIAGVNVPMMIKLMTARTSCNLADTVNQAQEAARKYINIAGNLLAGGA